MATSDVIDRDDPGRGDPATGAPTAPERSRPRRLVPVAVTALVVLPLAVAAVVLASRGWSPSGEFAQAEFRLRGFWSAVPDLGAVGRLRSGADVTSHPGPASWWLMYPAYALGGRSPAALSTSVAVVAGAWIAVSLWLAWRRGGTALVVVLGAVLALFVRALGPAVFTEPWNPWFAIFPFVCFLLAVWDVLCGHRWTLPLAVAAGTVCVQAHVGYAPLVAVGLVAPVAAVLWSLRRADRRRVGLGALGAATLVLVVMWLPPLVQQLRGDPGNMSLLVEAYDGQTDPALGMAGAVSLVGGRLDAAGPWLVADDTPPEDRGVGVGTMVLVALWAVAAAVAFRRRRDGAWQPVLVLHAVCGGAVVLGVVVASRVLGEVFDYLVPWLSVITAVVVAATAWTAWLWAGEARSPVLRRVLGVVGVVVLVGASVGAVIGFAGVDAPARDLSDTVDALGPQVAGTLDPGGTYLVRWEDPLAFGGAGFGLIADLERRGFTVGADDTYRVEVLGDRVVDPADADAAVWVVTGSGIERWRATPGAEEIATHDPRSPAQRREADRLRTGLREDLAAVGGAALADQLDTNYFVTRSDPRVDDALRERIDRWAALGAPTSVFLYDPGAPPAA